MRPRPRRKQQWPSPSAVRSSSSPRSSPRPRSTCSATDFEIRQVDGADRAALLPALADADAVLIRSATTIDAEALAAARRLKVVARAGIGLDNVDVPAATARGVMVVNAPTSNIVSAAEHAVALLLAVARNVPAADASLQAGEWKRSEVHRRRDRRQDRRRGRARPDRRAGRRSGSPRSASALIAYDPYVQPARAAAARRPARRPATSCWRESDFISIHLPKTPETLGLIGARELATAKPGVRIVNAARGGLIDEQALADAIAAGRVAGAGIDVFVNEPCHRQPAVRAARTSWSPRTWARPPSRRRTRPALAVARSVKLALQRRVRARRGERAGRRRRRRGRPARAAAGREARPGLHRAGRRRRRSRSPSRSAARSPRTT